jgi:hypothetical protein
MDDESARCNRDHAREATDRGASRNPPIENDAGSIDAKQRSGNTGNEHDSADNPERSRHSRRWCGENEYQSDADPKYCNDVQPVLRHYVSSDYGDLVRGDYANHACKNHQHANGRRQQFHVHVPPRVFHHC